MPTSLEIIVDGANRAGFLRHVLKDPLEYGRAAWQRQYQCRTS